MKRLFLAIFLMCSALAWGQATVGGHVSDLSDGTPSGTIAVQFDLINCGQTWAKIGSTKILLPLTQTFKVTSGVFTGTLRGNDVINCGNTYNTYYRVSRLYNGVRVGTALNYVIPDTGSWSLDTANPVAVVPPDPVIPYATFTPRGTWEDTPTKYAANDLVQFDGSTYRAKLASMGVSPDSSTVTWELWASKGTAGLDGSGNDPNAVHKTGDETIAGFKILSGEMFFSGDPASNHSLLTVNANDGDHGDGYTHFGYGTATQGAKLNNYIRGAVTWVDSTLQTRGNLDVVGGFQIKGANYVQPISWNLETPTTNDSGKFQANSGLGGTITKLKCYTIGSGTASISVEIRSVPNSTGTDILASPLTCSTTENSTTTFSTSALPADTNLALKITAASTPQVVVQLTYKP